MDANAKKTALRMIPYGLYVLTAQDKSGRAAAATVNWVTQVAFEPPLVVVGVKVDSHAHPLIKDAKGRKLRGNQMLEKTWVGATGQRWKLYVMFGLLAITVAWLAAMIAFLDRLPSDLGALALLVLFFMIFGFISWTFWSLSCPFCGNRVIWTVLRTRPHQGSVHVAFFFLTHCPACERSFFSEGSATIP